MSVGVKENIENFFYKNIYILLIFFAFIVVYAASLTYVYVDGDDARTIQWHVFEHDRSMARPYASYQGMWDAWLSLLPPHEPTLRIFAMTVSAIAGMFFTIVSMTLIFEWLEIRSWQKKAILSVIALIIFPELFFLGLVEDTALIGMPFILVSHLIARRLILTQRDRLLKREWISMLFSVLLFGLGVSLRWYLIFYGLVIVSDTVLFKKSLRIIKIIDWKSRISHSFSWGAGAILASLFFIAVSGQATSLYGTLVGNLKWMSSNIEYSMYSIVGLQTLITPASLMAAILGIWIMLQKRPDLLLTMIFSFITIILVLKAGETKQLLTFVPAFMLCSMLGIFKILDFSQNRLFKVIGIILAILALLPWFIGLKVYSSFSLWGPGFEVRKPGENIHANSNQLFNATVLSRSLPIEKISLGLGDGLALATGEGPRPLGAYGSVLLGGKWRSFVSARDSEMDNVIQMASSENIPILLSSWNPFLIIKAVSKGFYPTAPLMIDPDENGLYEHIFMNPNGQEFTIIYPSQPEYLFDPKRFDAIQRKISNTHALYLVTDSSVGLEMFRNGSGSIMPLGPFYGGIEINNYSTAISKSK
jgi:hypothetical protein